MNPTGTPWFNDQHDEPPYVNPSPVRMTGLMSEPYAHGLAFGALTSWRLIDRICGIDTTDGMDALLRLRDVADRLLAAEVTA